MKTALILFVFSLSCFAGSYDFEKSEAVITGDVSSNTACISNPSNVSNIVKGQFVFDRTDRSHLNRHTRVVGLPGNCNSGQIQISQKAKISSTGDTFAFDTYSRSSVWMLLKMKQHGR